MPYQEISSDGLRLVAGYLYEPMMTLGNAYQKLRTSTDALGEPWGNDETGIHFAETYVPARDQLFTTLGDVETGFRALQHNLYQAADSYDQTEQSNSH